MTRGRFITLEGGEGAGKTTQARLLAEALATNGVAVLRTREPGGAPGAEVLRNLLLAGEINWSPRAETLLHFAARAEHLAQTIMPALQSGQWVVCDRFFDSTMAYQGYGQGADRRFIQAQIDLLPIWPDLTIVLDVPDGVSDSRVRLRGADADRYERLDPAFHARVRAGFRSIAADATQRCAMFEASGDMTSVHTEIMRIVRARLCDS